MDLQIIRQKILGTPLLQSTPEALRQRLVLTFLAVAESRTASRTELLYKQGDSGEDRGLILLEGLVRVITETTDKKTISAPDILGEVNLFTPEATRTATVEVVVGGELLSFKWREVGALARELFTDDEMQQVRRAIADSARRRDETIVPKQVKS